MGYETHRFSVWVNCNLNQKDPMSEKQQDFEQLYEDLGFLMLPDSYTDDGKPTRLVIMCHGAGGTVTTDDSQVEKGILCRYLVANGYAVMDVNGLPYKYAEEYGIDIRNNIGSPIAMRCYVKGYHYCMKNFNLMPDVFVHGGSMGGISSTNLVLSGMIPVIAQSGNCPVLDTYNEIFLHPWSGGLPKTALGKIYELDVDENGEYIYDEKKICGHNPVRNKMVDYAYPVPVKFWQCVNDHVVSYEITKKFIERIQESGRPAYLRTFPYGGHEPSLFGEPVENPSGNDVFRGEKIKILPAAEEQFIWINSFN